MDASDDERQEEITTLSAIYPELVVSETHVFTASIDVPVTPSNPLTVRFPIAPPPSPPNSDDGRAEASSPVSSTDNVHQLHHLPPLHLTILLPDGYPADKPPQVVLSTHPKWLSFDKLQELERECEKLWEEYGHCQVLYSYIDFLQQAAERAFDLDTKGLDLLPALQPHLLAYNTITEKRLFDAETFDCGICLEPKKGHACYRMNGCNHVFCLACLQDFYNNCITEGDVSRVQCLDPTCGKDSANPRRRKRKSEKTLHPRELLAMGISEQMARRYVDMKRKKKLEADKTIIYCPRTWCQGPARSEKYPPIPNDLAQYPDSEDEEEEDDNKTTTTTEVKEGKENKPPISPSDRLRICSKCTFAFCKTCYASWHGEYARCWPRNPAELTEEEKASYDYIRLNTSPCPTCDSPSQKTMGCNHMTCFQCVTHFCYLCGAWLDGGNPYQHFNNPGTSCYQKLWELEEGDEGQGGEFAGARRWEAEARAIAEQADREDAEQLQREEDERAARELAERLDAQEAEAVAREAPPAQAREPARRGGRGAGWRARGAAQARAAVVPPRVQRPPQPQQQQAQRPDAAAAAAAALERFVELAVRDEEDGWDSDELEGDEQWEIRAR